MGRDLKDARIEIIQLYKRGLISHDIHFNIYFYSFLMWKLRVLI